MEYKVITEGNSNEVWARGFYGDAGKEKAQIMLGDGLITTEPIHFDVHVDKEALKRKIEELRNKPSWIEEHYKEQNDEYARKKIESAKSERIRQAEELEEYLNGLPEGAPNKEKTTEKPMSILNQDTDLLDNPKEIWMITSDYAQKRISEIRSKQAEIKNEIDKIKARGHVKNVESNIKNINRKYDLEQEYRALDEKAERLFGLHDGNKYHIGTALAGREFQKAVLDGKMTKEDAVHIIESAGFSAPEEIISGNIFHAEEIEESFSDCLKRNGINLEKENHRFEVGTTITGNNSGIKYSVSGIFDSHIEIVPLSDFKKDKVKDPISLGYSEIIEKFRDGIVSVSGFSPEETMEFARVLNTIQHCAKMDKLYQENEKLKVENTELKNSDFNEGLSYLLLPKGKVSQIGEESGDFIPDGISVFKSPHGSYRYLISVDGNPVAAIQVMSRDGESGFVTNAYVVPGERRKGYGKTIMNFIRKDFKSISFSDDLSGAGRKFVESQKTHSVPAVEVVSDPTFAPASAKIKKPKRGDVGIWNGSERKILSIGKNVILAEIDADGNEIGARVTVEKEEFLSGWKAVKNEKEISSDIKETIKSLQVLLSVTDDPSDKKQIKEQIKGLKLLLK